jgi:16S rRNA processing protein RimM
VDPVTDFPERFVAGARLFWRRLDDERELTIAAVRPHGARLLVRFDGVDAPEAARELSGGDLSVPESEAIPPPEDFYYGHRIAGWRCEDTGGRVLGTVAGLERAGGVPLLTIDSGGKEPVSVPFTRPIVVSVDASNETIILDPPEGLMDL